MHQSRHSRQSLALMIRSADSLSLNNFEIGVAISITYALKYLLQTKLYIQYRHRSIWPRSEAKQSVFLSSLHSCSLRASIRNVPDRKDVPACLNNVRQHLF